MCNPTEEPKETKVEAISEKYQRMKRKKPESEKVETRQETKDRQLVDKLLDKYKGNSAIDRFCENYISTGTKATYLRSLDAYFKWLSEEKGISLTPDQLIEDSDNCLNEKNKKVRRKHTDLLSEYINTYLVNKGNKHKGRELQSNAIRQLYKQNDSNLTGSYRGF